MGSFPDHEPYPDTVRAWLAEHRAEIDARDGYGYSPIVRMAVRNRHEVVTLLLEAGADLEQKARAAYWTAELIPKPQAGEWSILEFALHHGATDVVALLVAAGCPIPSDTSLPSLAKGKQTEATIPLFRGLVAGGASIDQANELGETALYMCAALGSRVELLQACLELGADPNQLTHTGKSALWAATKLGRLEEVEALLSRGADPELTPADERSPLSQALRLGYPEVVLSLLRHGAAPPGGPEARNLAAEHPAERLRAGIEQVGLDQLQSTSRSKGSQCLWHLHKKHPEVIVPLCEAGMSPDAEHTTSYGQTVSKSLALTAAPETVRRIFALSGERGRLLQAVAARGDVELVDWMIEHGARDDPEWHGAITSAASKGHVELARHLVALGASPAMASPLSSAAKDPELVRFLLAHGADPDGSGGLPPIFHASRDGYADTVSLLIGAGAQLDGQSSDGTTALMAAVSKGHHEVVKALLSAGADVTLTNARGKTAADLAGSRDDIRAALNVAPVRRDTSGLELPTPPPRSPLEAAILRGDDAAAIALAKTSDEVDAPNRFGMTPLLTAAALGRASVVDALLEAGASVHHKATSGATAASLAQLMGHAAIARTLEKARAPLDITAMANTMDVLMTFTTAVREGDVDTIVQSVRDGLVDPALPTGRASTPLLDALFATDSLVVDLLLRLGAPVDSSARGGVTPLMVAAECGGLGWVQRFVEAGADVNARMHTGDTALLLAARQLVRAEGEVVRAALTQIVRQLVAAGADRESTDAFGATAHDYATGAVAEILGVPTGAKATIETHDDRQVAHRTVAALRTR